MTDENDKHAGSGHPLPRSDEARHDLIPEHLETEKGLGDDAAEALQPSPEPVDPDGETYGPDKSGG